MGYMYYGAQVDKIEREKLVELASKELEAFEDELARWEIDLTDWGKFIESGEDEYWIETVLEAEYDLTGTINAIYKKYHNLKEATKSKGLELSMFAPTAEVLSGDESGIYIVENAFVPNLEIRKDIREAIYKTEVVMGG